MKLNGYLIIISFLFACDIKKNDDEETLLPNFDLYTSYFTGKTLDIETSAKGGVCLMGGSSETDNAMRWFLDQSNGGDILVLRTSGSDGYNNYMYKELGVSINSIETLVIKTIEASYDDYLLNKIEKAEGIWFAGGNQWTYVNYWKNTPVDSLINEAIKKRNIVIGGTSAGMAILGEKIFSAEFGSLSSIEALNDPFNGKVSIDSMKYISIPFLNDVITDTHYSERNRYGRHVTMMARLKINGESKGIGLDEKTSICISKDGIASVYGINSAFFIKSNSNPEICISGENLTWNNNEQALSVYEISASLNGLNSFDLNDWVSGSGGKWYNWFVEDGKLFK